MLKSSVTPGRDGVVFTAQLRTWSYTELGFLQSLQQPESGTTTYADFTVTGKPMTTSYAGRVVRATYDTLMRPLTVTSDDGSVDQAFQYDAASGHGAALNARWTARDQGIEETFTYGDAAGRLTGLGTTVWSGGAVGSGTQEIFPQSFAYDTYGNRVQALAGHSAVGTAYDLARGVPLAVVRNGTTGPAVATATLDATSWAVTGLSYGNGASTLYTYGADQARLATLSHYESGGGAPLVQWTYAYDGAGRLTGDGEDSYRYDTLGRLTQALVQRLDGAGSVTQDFLYDAFGNTTSSVTTGNLPSSSLPGSNLNNFTLTSTEQAAMAATNRLPQDSTTGASYDAQGNLVSFFAQAGQPGSQISLTYDALGRVVSMADAKRPGYSETYAYTADGLRTLVQEVQNGTLTKRRYNLYNDARQLVSQYEQAVTGGQSLAQKASGVHPMLVMPPDPLMPDIAAPAPGAVVAVATPVSFMGSDDNYPNATLSWAFGDGVTASGPNTSHTYATTGTYTIRLTSSKSGLTSKSITETLTVTAGPTAAPVITAFRTSTDAIAPGGSDTLSWTVSGASSFSLDNGTGAVTGSSKVVTPSATTTYTLTATNAIGSTTAQVTVIVDPLLTTLTWKRDLIYLGGKEVAEFDANGMHVTHEDHLGSPRLITNTAGKVESRQKYLPFGETLDAALPGTYGPGKGFTNHEATEGSGLIYMQARYYAPQWHRFTAPDPARDQHFEETQSWNIYSYVRNQPTMQIDPTGMLSMKETWQKLKNAVKFGHWETDAQNSARIQKGTDAFMKAHGYDKFDTSGGAANKSSNPKPSQGKGGKKGDEKLDKDKFAKHLDANALSRSSGKCAKFVRKGLEAGGVNTSDRPRDAGDYGQFLERHGAEPAPSGKEAPQKGDVAVFKKNDTHPYGHVEGYDGEHWVSDFKQNGYSPYRTDTPPSTVYRFPDK